MLLENCCSEHCRFETMRGSCSNDAAKSAHGIASGLGVIRKIIEPALHSGRRAKLVDDFPFGCRQVQCRRIDAARIGKSHPLLLFQLHRPDVALSIAEGEIKVCRVEIEIRSIELACRVRKMYESSFGVTVDRSLPDR